MLIQAQAVLKLDTNNMKAKFRLGQGFFGLKKYERAIEYLNAAKNELTRLNQLYDTLKKQKDAYKSTEVAIQIKAGEAWIQFASGNKQVAVTTMKLAANMEDSTGKHLVTPGEVLPARELLGDMFLQMNDNDNALQAYEAVLTKCANRFNSLYGAAKAAANKGDIQKAIYYYKHAKQSSENQSVFFHNRKF